jgi:hypothetical protein
VVEPLARKWWTMTLDLPASLLRAGAALAPAA